MEGWTRGLTGMEGSRVGGRVGGLEVAVVAAVYLVLPPIVGAVMEYFGVQPQSATGLLLLVLAGFLSAVLGVALAVALPTGASAASFGLKRPPTRWLLIGVGLGLLAWFVGLSVGALVGWIGDGAGSPRPQLTEFASQATTPQIVLFSIMACTLAPLAEELLFRGVLYGWLRRWGLAVAVVVSALAFGLSHGLNLVFFTSAALGVITALAYERSGSLWPAVAAHATMNTTMALVGF